MDGHADAGDAGSVGHREIVAGHQRNLADDADFAAHVHHEGAVADAEHVHDVKRPQMLDDGFAVLFVARLQGDFADLVVSWLRL